MPAAINELENQAGEELNPEPAPHRPKPPDPGFGCVYLTSSTREAELVSTLVEAERIRIYHAVTLDDAASQLKLTHCRVFLTNTKFRSGNWREALNLSTVVRPQVALVVASRIADDKLWLGVLERGAYDLIVKPFKSEELCRILRNAHDHAASGGLRHMTA